MNLPKELQESLTEELIAWRTEANFDLAFRAAYWVHALGEIVRRYHKGELTLEVIQNLRSQTGKSRATLFKAVELYDKDPDYDHLIAPYGKNISVDLLLGKERKRDKCPHTQLKTVMKCEWCGKVMI